MGTLVYLFPDNKDNQQIVKSKVFSQEIAKCCNDASRGGLDMDLLLVTCAKVLVNAMDRMDDPKARKKTFVTALTNMMKD